MSMFSKEQPKKLVSFSLVLLNKSMRQYNAKDIASFFGQHEQHITHVIVAHTKHRPFVASTDMGRFQHVRADQYIAAKLQQTSKDTRHALNCFYSLLYPDHSNRPKQNPNLFKPLTFVTVEGAKETTDRSQTIHVNISLGKLPSVLDTGDIETLFRHAWHNMANQSSDVKAYPHYTVEGVAHWTGYSLKEAQQNSRKAWDTNSIWDVNNCWIPHAALEAD